MSIDTYTKLQIACEYLDLAMNLFLEKRDYFCVIHLAGAADEILGKHLPEEHSSYTRQWKAHKALETLEGRSSTTVKEAKSFINRTKNSVKHMNRPVDDIDDSQIEIDPVEEAEWLIESALSNFYKLGLRKTPTLRKYEEQNAKNLQE